MRRQTRVNAPKNDNINLVLLRFTRTTLLATPVVSAGMASSPLPNLSAVRHYTHKRITILVSSDLSMKLDNISLEETALCDFFVQHCKSIML